MRCGESRACQKNQTNKHSFLFFEYVGVMHTILGLAWWLRGRETWIQFLGCEAPLEKETATSTLALENLMNRGA